MNHVTLIGRLTSDPSLSYTPNTQTAIASFRLAVSRETKDGGADFIQCKVFGKQAENLQQYKHKGDEIAVQGRIQTETYEKRDGTKGHTVEVICNRIEYTHGSKGGESAPREESKYTDPSVKQMVEEELPDSFEAAEDDIPF